MVISEVYARIVEPETYGRHYEVELTVYDNRGNQHTLKELMYEDHTKSLYDRLMERVVYTLKKGLLEYESKVIR